MVLIQLNQNQEIGQQQVANQQQEALGAQQRVGQQFAQQQAQLAQLSGGLSQAAVNTGQATPQIQGPASDTALGALGRKRKRKPVVGGPLDQV